MMRFKVIVDGFYSNRIWVSTGSIVELNKRPCCVVGNRDEIRKYKFLWGLIVADFDDEILILLALRLKTIMTAYVLFIFIYDRHAC